MNQKITHYSLLASASVLAVVAILLGFSQYNNALGVNNLGANSNVAAVASVNPAPGNNNNNPTGKAAVPAYWDSNLRQAVAVINTFLSPSLTPNQANGSEFAQYSVFQTASVPPDTYSSLGGGPEISNMCHHPISIATAKQIQRRMNEHGVNADFLTATSSQYVQINSPIWAACGIGRAIGNVTCIVPDTAPVFGYCLDVGYVSNYPTYINNYTAFSNSHPVLGYVYKFGETPASINLAARSGLTSSASGTGSSASATF